MAEAPSDRKRPRFSSPISRILSWITIYLGRPLPDGSCGQPRDSGEQPSSVSCSALHRVGLAWPPCHHGAGALLPHHFTIAAGRTGVLCNFCCAFPRVSPAGRYPAPCSMVSGLSSKAHSRASPRGYPGCTGSIPRTESLPAAKISRSTAPGAGTPGKDRPQWSTARRPHHPGWDTTQRSGRPPGARVRPP